MRISFLEAFTASALVSVIAVVSLSRHLQFRGDLAAIESLRRDVARTGCSVGEDVAGQVAEWNQRLATCRAWNRTWWTDWYYPDGCDAVQPIAMPDCP